METRSSVRSGSPRAVSPVIGVVLMVAITVILAAVLGTFALGLSDGREPAPQASFWTTVTDDVNLGDGNDGAYVTIVHEGGDPIDAARTRVIVRLVEADGTGDAEGDADIAPPSSTGATLTAGSRTTYEVRNNDWTGAWSSRDPATTTDLTDPNAGETVRVTIVDVETESIVYRKEFEVQG
jgi:flagellin-like protein